MTEFSNPLAYETWMGRWSEKLAPLFLEFTACAAPGRYLDVGSGTGAMTRAILDTIEDCAIVGVEPSPDYVEFAGRKVSGRRATFRTGDALDLPFEPASFDGAVALLVLQEVPDPAKMVGEMRRVTRAGGCVAACQWDFRTGMPSLSRFWEAVAEVLPEDEARRQAEKRAPFGYSDLESLHDLWKGAGLNGIETAELEITMDFASFGDYWQPFLGGATPTSSYAMTLPNALRNTLEERLRSTVLGSAPEGPFSLPARALAVKGQA